MVLKSMLEEHGVQVSPPDENVFLNMVVSGPLDMIKAAVAQLHRQFPRTGPVTIDDEIEGTPPPHQAAPQQCLAITAKGSRCKLPAEPGGTRCAIHRGPRRDGGRH